MANSGVMDEDRFQDLQKLIPGRDSFQNFRLNPIEFEKVGRRPRIAFQEACVASVILLA